MPVERARTTSRHDLLKKSRERKQRQRLFRLSLATVFCLVLLLGVVMVSRAERFQLRAVNISGTAELANGQVQAAVDSVLAGNYWGLFPRQNLWLLPEKKIRASLQQQFPPIAAVSLAVASDHVLRVQISERQAVAVVCAMDPAVIAECYFIDQTGIVFAPATKLTGYFIWRLPLVAAPTLGEPIFPPDHWSKLMDWPQQLDTALAGTILAGQVATEAVTETAGDYRLWLRRPNGDMSIVINAREDLAAALLNLRSVLLSNIFLTAWRERAGHLSYLDLRFPPKVFYKFN